ncbi:hypothetical protein STAS_13306 [Striga asiatica]|uniref:B3 domain-containing protein n=1 Tax=Striga asiatica TaxID=4170 RepID=A0A5A7PW94_STRAF|nr:hypothetical protein STAS_13306 [Striga asiatica]
MDMDVDTTLRLSNTPPDRRRRPRRRKTCPNLSRFAREVDSSTFLTLGPATQEEVLCPTPLRAIYPDHGVQIIHAPPPSPASQDSGEQKPPAKRKSEDRPGPSGSKYESGRKKSKSGPNGDGPHAPCVPPEVLQKTGPGLVFLFKKKMENSDVRENMNRLFVTAKGTAKMKEEFMTEEEKRAIWPDEEGPAGIEFTGLDKAGKEYKLGITLWRSLRMTAIKTEWFKMVVANEAKSGDWVDVWGCRRQGQEGFRLVFIFSAGGGRDLIV